MIAHGPVGDQENVVDSIAWTNLYKVSKSEGDNPSQRLMKVQHNLCKNILMLEIEHLQPKAIVF